MTNKTVDSSIYTSGYFLERCGGVEFFHKYGHKILKPAMQAAVLSADLKQTDRILDIGCGRGELVAHLDEKGFDATGIDYSEDAIKCAKESYPKGKFLLVRSDETLFEPQSFDKVFLLGTIEHLYEHEIEKTLREIKRVLKPGGICLITTCTNLLYYKTQTFKLRYRIAQWLGRIGLKIKLPAPPRSDEDQSVHINEKHYFSLKKSLQSEGLRVKIIPRPNPKLSSIELYGKNLPADFPLRAKSAIKQFFFRNVVFHFPLNLLLARTYLVVASEKGGGFK